MIWSKYRTEIWEIGILRAPIADVVTNPRLTEIPVTWLPRQADFCFIADPFGLWRDGLLYVFCEFYDYRTKRGTIRYFVYDAGFAPVGEGEALNLGHHLSFPILMEEGGEVFMLPESYQSGSLNLYRAQRFPDAWEKVAELLPHPVIDPAIVKHGGKWWLFFTLPGERQFEELHVAFADSLTGPWQLHPGNPVRVSRTSARPGGTPFMLKDHLHLPTQDCDGDYGRAVSLLRIDMLTERDFRAELIRRIAPDDFGLAAEGLHTLSACGPVTLFDVKRIDRSSKRLFINVQRRLRRLLRGGL